MLNASLFLVMGVISLNSKLIYYTNSSMNLIDAKYKMPLRKKNVTSSAFWLSKYSIGFELKHLMMVASFVMLEPPFFALKGRLRL